MTRYAGSYELEPCFKRSSPRLAAAFSAYTPACCSSSVWVPYELLSGRWVVRHLAMQSFRMCGVFPDARELLRTSYGSFATQYAARAQARMQLLASTWLLPAASLKNVVMATDFLASSLAVCREQMIQGSVCSRPYESTRPFGPWGRNAVRGNVVGALALAQIANVKGARASKFRHHFGGGPRLVGGSRTSRSRQNALRGRVATMFLMCVTK